MTPSTPTQTHNAIAADRQKSYYRLIEVLNKRFAFNGIDVYDIADQVFPEYQTIPRKVK